MNKIKNYLIVVILTIFSHTLAFSQTSSVSGLVVDSDSLYSVSNVAVFLLDANQQIVSKVATNNKGMFVLDNVSPGTYKIRTIAPGYKVMISKQFEVVAKNTKYNFKIKINNLEVGETNVFNEQDYNEYLDLLEDREILNDDK